MLRVLFVCTENACRSQMAEGLVNHDLAGKVQAFSAGVSPTSLNPRAVKSMAEIGIDLSGQRAKSIIEFASQKFDLVVTVCDRAREECPMIPGEGPRIHVGYPDPAQAKGTEEEIMAAFRRVREEMRSSLIPLIEAELARQQKEKE
jgi:arsenate reductase